MASRSIATHWHGVYSYDPMPELPDSFIDTHFALHLTLGWFGRFKGVAHDAPEGIPEPATIRGRLTRSRIRFRKQYPSMWVTDESGNQTTVPDQPSHVLHYNGEFSDDRQRMTGTWRSVEELRWIDGVQWYFPEYTGTWSATPQDH